MRLDKLFARAVNGKTLEYVVEVEGNKFRTISGYTDGIKTTSEWTVCNQDILRLFLILIMKHTLNQC